MAKWQHIRKGLIVGEIVKDYNEWVKIRLKKRCLESCRSGSLVRFSWFASLSSHL